jgi:hypothetical protein
MALIKESFVLTASNTDVLVAPSRLTSAPRAGTMTLEISATDSDPTNYGTITLQLPNGDVPLEDLVIPQNGYSTADGVIHDDTAIQISFGVAQGGHVLLSYTENGTVAQLNIMATLEF